jgi:hypothetical protein
MARKVRYDAFESRSARLNKFKVRRRPYSGPSLARGILLMYRRNKTNGTWVLKASDGHGGSRADRPPIFFVGRSATTAFL